MTRTMKAEDEEPMPVPPLLEIENLSTHLGSDTAPVRAVDGVSLTVVDAAADSFSVAVIPHTSEVTTLGHRPSGSVVNLEVDVMAKYAESLLGGYLAGGAPAPEEHDDDT
mgnify:CR=1 FL=1